MKPKLTKDEQAHRRERREQLTVARKQARKRGAFSHAESEHALRKSLETAYLEGEDREAARLRELIRLRHLHAKMAPAYHELRRELWWRGTLEAIANAAEEKIPAIRRLANAVNRNRYIECLDEAQRAKAVAKRKARKAKRHITKVPG